MINKIKRKIRQFENRFRKIDKSNDLNRQHLELLEDNQQMIFDYSHLSKLFSNGEFIPLTRWSLSPSTIIHVLNDVYINDRRNIIEFGAGGSSLYIAKFIQKLNLNVKFYCIESDINWLKKIEFLSNQYGLTDNLTLVHAPLKEVQENLCFGSQKQWYDTQILSNAIFNGENFDLILIDGPAGQESDFIRYSAIPFLRNSLSENVSIFLDDTYRKEELMISEMWKEELKLTLNHFNKYSLLIKNENYSVIPFDLSNWSTDKIKE